MIPLVRQDGCVFGKQKQVQATGMVANLSKMNKSEVKDDKFNLDEEEDDIVSTFPKQLSLANQNLITTFDNLGPVTEMTFRSGHFLFSNTTPTFDASVSYKGIYGEFVTNASFTAIANASSVGIFTYARLKALRVDHYHCGITTVNTGVPYPPLFLNLTFSVSPATAPSTMYNASNVFVIPPTGTVPISQTWEFSAVPVLTAASTLSATNWVNLAYAYANPSTIGGLMYLSWPVPAPAVTAFNFGYSVFNWTFEFAGLK